MDYKLCISAQAQKDIEAIYNYVLKDGKEIKTLMNILNKHLMKIYLLSSYNIIT